MAYLEQFLASLDVVELSYQPAEQLSQHKHDLSKWAGVLTYGLRCSRLVLIDIGPFSNCCSCLQTSLHKTSHTTQLPTTGLSDARYVLGRSDPNSRCSLTRNNLPILHPAVSDLLDDIFNGALAG